MIPLDSKILISRNGGDTWAEYKIAGLHVPCNRYAIGRCIRPKPISYFVFDITREAVVALKTGQVVAAMVMSEPVQVKMHS